MCIRDRITGNQEQDSSAIKTLLQNNAYQVTDVSLATGDLDEDAKFAIDVYKRQIVSCVTDCDCVAVFYDKLVTAVNRALSLLALVKAYCNSCLLYTSRCV